MKLYYDGRPVTITGVRVLDSGADGMVIGTDSHPRFCLKVYRSTSADRDARIAALLRMPPVDWRGTDDYHAAWPLRSLTDESGHVRVVVVRRAYGASLHALFDPEQRRDALASPTWATMLKVALNLTRLFADLHRIGVVVGDVSPGNILVGHDGQVVLIDCDSVQFTDPATGREFPAHHLTPEYAAPESVRATTPGRVARLTVAHDLFGLAVIICQLLMEGDHPFEGVLTGGIDRGTETNIQEGNCRLLFPERFVPVPGQLTSDLLPPRVAQLAWQALVDGHRDASRRPSTEQWEAALRSARNDLIGCRYEPGLHFYRQGLESCIWCHRRRALLGDHYRWPQHDARDNARDHARNDARDHARNDARLEAAPPEGAPPGDAVPPVPVGPPMRDGHTTTNRRYLRRRPDPPPVNRWQP